MYMLLLLNPWEYFHETLFVHLSHCDDVSSARKITLGHLWVYSPGNILCPGSWGGWVVRRCCVSYITGASSWYWLTVGQGLLSLYQVRVEGECFYFFCFFTFIPVPLSSLAPSFISSTISSISFLRFSGRWHKMTLKGWRVVKPQHNVQALTLILVSIVMKPYVCSP